MKVRFGFVSNSSTSSFIVVLARVKNLNKAKKFIEEHDNVIELYTHEELSNMIRRNSYDIPLYMDSWCDVDIVPSEGYMNKYPDSYFVGGYESHDEHELDFDDAYDYSDLDFYSFSELFEPFENVIEEMSKATDTFADIDTAYACGRDG